LIYQSINQSINHSINQSINQSYTLTCLPLQNKTNTEGHGVQNSTLESMV